ncbi:MAG: hypothetical protein ACJAU1_001252 [Psychromonas sp.]
MEHSVIIDFLNEGSLQRKVPGNDRQKTCGAIAQSGAIRAIDDQILPHHQISFIPLRRQKGGPVGETGFFSCWAAPS